MNAALRPEHIAAADDMAGWSTGSQASRIAELIATNGQLRAERDQHEADAARLRGLLREQTRIANLQGALTAAGVVRRVNCHDYNALAEVLAAVSAKLIDSGMTTDDTAIDYIDAAADLLQDAHAKAVLSTEDEREARLQAQTEPLARAQGVL